MTKTTINRRQFLASSGRGVAGGVAVTLAPTLLAADDNWPAKLTAIDAASAPLWVRVCRVLYPHDRLHDGYYIACVEKLDARAATDAALATQLSDGAITLNTTAGGAFLERSEAEQAEILKGLEGEGFFQSVRGHMVVALYTDTGVWAELGYEGPSFPYGGYLERGFNDIDWLPET